MQAPGNGQRLQKAVGLPLRGLCLDSNRPGLVLGLATRTAAEPENGMIDTSPGTRSRAEGVEMSVNVDQNLLLLWFIRLPGQSVCRSVVETKALGQRKVEPGKEENSLCLAGVLVLRSPKILEVLVVCQYQDWVLCFFEPMLPFFQGQLHCQ